VTRSAQSCRERGDVEAIEETAANASHEAVKGNADAMMCDQGSAMSEIAVGEKRRARTVGASAEEGAAERAAPLGKPLVPEV